MRQHTSAYELARIRVRVVRELGGYLLFVFLVDLLRLVRQVIDLHTSAYASIRQHTSAYVSQHTSALIEEV